MSIRNPSGPRHKVFVSYHHKNDQGYRNRFEKLFCEIFNIMDSRSVNDSDVISHWNDEAISQKIRNKYLSDSTVTVVLIGNETWKRKHVDWEIAASVRDTNNSPRSGLLGIYLPTFKHRNNYGQYDKHRIPFRLLDNHDCGYASLHNWSENPAEVQKWIHTAFLDRKKIIPNNSRTLFKGNRY